MKIENIEAIRVSIPFETGGKRQGMRPGLTPWLKMESFMVRIDTDDGLSGWGEGFGHFVNPATEAALESQIGPWFLGRDPGDVPSLMGQAHRSFFGFGRQGPVMYALAAVDTALWDLAAKRAGEPLYRLLGGRHGELRRYASLMRYGGDAEAIASNCVRARDAGFGMIKLHEREVPAFMAARESVDAEVQITLDVNCPWSVDEARRVAREIRDKNFHWLEEPVWPPDDFEGLAAVRKEGVAIAAGENVHTLHELQRCLEAGAVDIVQPSVAKVGGITPMRQMIDVAQARGVRVVPHSFYWGPGYLATAHVIAAMPEPALLETAFVSFEVPPHPLMDPTLPTLNLPDAPGLGFEPDWPALRPYVVSEKRAAG
ncbi:MAG TPA: mandelate racemase/muconate lactonizing enzyme family protein [Gammaproteobacteria bacterium]|nr:mandelate racemase/muconate lactonizing enzyme family protein [Gammaproteobacteria bacterium]